MIFSETKWDKAKEIRAFVPVGAALSFDKMEAPLGNAQDMFLLPILGDSMIAKLQEIYDQDTERNEKDKKFLFLAQTAVANIAFWYDFDALNLRITDQGFQRQQSDSFPGAYKYQEDHLCITFKNKGFNAIDQLLFFLEDHVSDYEEFKSSPGYTIRENSIVRNTEEVNRIVFINASRIIFMRMQNIFHNIEENELQPVLGETLYSKLREWLSDSSKFELTTTTLEKFRSRCAAFVIMKAAARLISETGTLTDRGLYFTTVGAGPSGNEVKQPATTDDIAWRVKVAENDAEMYKTTLIRFISLYMTAYESGNSQHALDRDNTDKSTFFA